MNSLAPLATYSGAGGWRVAHYARLSSTNDEARRLAATGDPGRLWVRADEQTLGRGRLGRVWASPPGNHYASALLIEPCAPAIAPQLGFVAGLALAQAVQDLGAIGVELKWPNDLVFARAKLGGLLVEGIAFPAQHLAAIIGFGVNCAHAPEGLGRSVTHLSAILKRAIAPGELFDRLAIRLDESLRLWRAGENFRAIRAAWLSHAASLGQTIQISGPSGVRVGVFEGIDENGRLLLRGVHGLEVVETADVDLTPPAKLQEKAFKA